MILDILFWIVVSIIAVYGFATNSVIAISIVTLIFIWRTIVATKHVVKEYKDSDV